MFLDGTHVSIRADTYRKSLEQDGDTPRQRRFLKLYLVTDLETNSTESFDELTLEERLGKEAFDQLPT